MNNSATATPPDLSLLKLMHLVSPALPVGAYAYSQGLEYAIDSGWLKDEAGITEWISQVLHTSLGGLDLPILQRCYNAWELGENDCVDRWNTFLRASRETKELLLEDEQLGIALSRLLVDLGIEEAAAENFSAPPSFVTLFALAGVRWQVSLPQLLEGFAWSWLENQIAAATKIVPLGQTQAQRLLVVLMKFIPEVCRSTASVKDADLGAGLPGLAMASSRHERQYSRLFRS